MYARRILSGVIAFALALIGGAATPWRAEAQSSAFTYQGQLQRNGTPTTDQCDFQFGLFSTASGDVEVAPAITVNGVNVSNGLFTTQLDFGFDAFNREEIAFLGADRFLEISVRCPAGSGSFSKLSPRQPLTPVPYALFAPLVARDAAGNFRALIDTFDDGSGYLRTRGSNGSLNVEVQSDVENPDLGVVTVYDANDETRVELKVLGADAGFVGTRGPSGNDNVHLTYLSNYPDHGFVSVQDATGTTRAGMYVNENGQGEIFADVKDFVVDHPTRPGSKIIYSSLEGPEVAIYDRGVVKLVKGRAIIALPEHFTALASPDSITVQLTPRSFESEGLGFQTIDTGHIEVRELHHGTGTYDVDFVVYALRRGYEDRQPVIASDVFRARFSAQASNKAAASKRTHVALHTTVGRPAAE